MENHLAIQHRLKTAAAEAAAEAARKAATEAAGPSGAGDGGEKIIVHEIYLQRGSRRDCEGSAGIVRHGANFSASAWAPGRRTAGGVGVIPAGPTFVNK